MAEDRETKKLTLEVLRWELDRAFEGIHAVFQRMAIVFASISIGAVFLPRVFIFTTKSSNLDISGNWFVVFSIGVLALIYAGYLSVRAMWGNNTFVRQILGSARLQADVLPLTEDDAIEVLVKKYMFLVTYNQADLVSRRNRMNRAMLSTAIGYLMIGLSLWYSINLGF